MASAVLLGVPANLRITKNDDTRKRWAESGKYQHIRLDSTLCPHHPVSYGCGGSLEEAGE